MSPSMNTAGQMNLAIRTKRGLGGSNEEEQPTLKKQRLETTLATLNAASGPIEKRKHLNNYEGTAGDVSMPDAKATERVQHDVEGEKITANTLCWTVFKNAPSQHLLACGHVIDTIVSVCCGTRCMLPPGVVVKTEGPAIECMEQKCLNIMKGIQVREARRKNVSIFMPKKKRPQLQRACKPESKNPDGAGEESSLFVKAEDDEQPERRKARLDANLNIDGTEKLKSGLPVRRAADSPFFILPDRYIHADEDKGDKIDPFHASFPQPPEEHEEPSFDLAVGPVVNKTKQPVDTDAFTCDGCQLQIFDFAHHCKTCTDRDFCNSCWPGSKCHELSHDFTVVIIDNVAKQTKTLRSAKSKELEDIAARESEELSEPKMPIQSLADLRKITRKVAETKKISLAVYGTRQQVKKRLEEARTRGDHERFTRDFPTTDPPSVNLNPVPGSDRRPSKAAPSLRRKSGIGDLAGASKMQGSERKASHLLGGVKEADEDVKMADA